MFSAHAFALCESVAVHHQIGVNPLAGVVLGHVTVHVHHETPLYVVTGVHVRESSLPPFPFTLKLTVIVL